MNKPKYIQDDSFLMVFAIALFCIAIVWWIYWSDKKRKEKLEKKNETVDIYTKSLSWRVYIIVGTGLLIMIWEMIKRIINFLS